MSEEQKQALIEDCQDEISKLERAIRNVNSYAKPAYRDEFIYEYQSQLKRQQIALAALTAQHDDWKRRAEAAEAKLAGLEKQEPFAWISSGEQAILSRLKKHSSVEVGLFNVQRFSDDTPLFTSAPIPTGWKIVPIEPTERMVIAGFESEPDEDFSEPEVWEAFQMMSGCQQAAYKSRLCWSAMIDAAPTPPE